MVDDVVLPLDHIFFLLTDIFIFVIYLKGTSVGIRCLDGVVLGVEKLIISPMIVPGSGRRVFNVAPHIGMSLAGLTADQRQIVVRARSEASQYLDSFAVPIPPRILAERVAAFMHAYVIDRLMHFFVYYWLFATSSLIFLFDMFL